jgi:hypothetical protein
MNRGRGRGSSQQGGQYTYGCDGHLRDPAEACDGAAGAEWRATMTPIRHVVVVIGENHVFGNICVSQGECRPHDEPRFVNES